MNRKALGATLVATIVCMAAVAILINAQLYEPVITVQKEGIWSKPLPYLGDGDPGGDQCGIMYWMAYPHSGTPATTYASNLSNATAYEYRDTLNGEANGDTPYSTAFDVLIKFRVNDTVGYNVSSSSWEISWVRANMTIDFDYATDTAALQEMTIVEIANNSDFAWYHGYLQDHDGGAGSGFQITHGERYNCTAIQAQVYE